MVVMHLDTAYVAGLFGYALAEYRQFIGVDTCAAEIPMPSSLTEEELQQNSESCGCMCVLAAIVSLLCAAGAAGVLCVTRDTFWLIVKVSFLVDLSIYCWTCVLTLPVLRGVLVELTSMTMIYLLGPSLLFVVNLLVFYLFGMAIGTLVHSLGMIGMAGFFGYSLGVYAHYKHLVTLLDQVSTEATSKLPLVPASNETVTKEED